MVDPDASSPAAARAGTSPRIRDVADDMAAIFGPAQRTHPIALPDAGRSAPVRRRHRRWVGAVAVGGVAAMLAAGVVGGRNVIEAPATPPAKTIIARKSAAPPVAAPIVEPVRIAAAMPPADLPPPAVPAATVDEPVVPSETAPRPSAADDRADMPTRAVTPRSEPPSRVLSDGGSALSVVSTRQVECFSEASCLAPQLRSAERSVAVAYDQATAAQVRAGTLRDYRDEWIRARRVALKRPREALRIYGMIVSDLRIFADDAAQGGRMLR